MILSLEGLSRTLETFLEVSNCQRYAKISLLSRNRKKRPVTSIGKISIFKKTIFVAEPNRYKIGIDVFICFQNHLVYCFWHCFSLSPKNNMSMKNMTSGNIIYFINF